MTTLRAVLPLVLAAAPAAGAPPTSGPASLFASGRGGPEGLMFLWTGTG